MTLNKFRFGFVQLLHGDGQYSIKIRNYVLYRVHHPLSYNKLNVGRNEERFMFIRAAISLTQLVSVYFSSTETIKIFIVGAKFSFTPSTFTGRFNPLSVCYRLIIMACFYQRQKKITIYHSATSQCLTYCSCSQRCSTYDVKFINKANCLVVGVRCCLWTHFGGLLMYYKFHVKGPSTPPWGIPALMRRSNEFLSLSKTCRVLLLIYLIIT